MQVKISHEIPDIYYRIKRSFPINWESVVIAYGDTIYARDPMPDHLIEHEKVHLAQQEKFGGADAWWDRYLIDPKFRLEQELEAHQVQVRYIKQDEGMNRQTKRSLIVWIAKQLTGTMYGSIITYKKAFEAINL